MAIDLNILAQEIENPEYQAFYPGSPGAVVELLNRQGRGTKIGRKSIGIGSIMDALGPTEGAALLDTLESLKGTVPTIKWAFYLLERADLDVGLASTRAAIDGLVLQGVMTETQGAVIKALAEVPASRAEVLFGPGTVITEADVKAAVGEF